MTARSDTGRQQPYATTTHLVEMLDALFQAFRRRSSMALPEFVLHADSDLPDADHRVEGILGGLREQLQARGVPFAAVRQPSGASDGLTPRMRALHIVQALGGKPPPDIRDPYIEANAWRGSLRQYGTYAFPRSALLSAIEDVVAEDNPAHDPEGLLISLNNKNWRPGGTQRASRLRDAVTDASRTVPALLIAGVAVLLTDKPWYITLGFLAAVLAGLLLLSILPGKAPLFLGLRPEVRWFLGTTYLNQAPGTERGQGGLTWRLLRLWPPGTVRQRVAAVARDIQDGGLLRNSGSAAPGNEDEDAQRRHLQLRVHALREDLRDAHLAWSLDMRGRKRPTPPVLVLPESGVDNGHIELIKAISDIRSIRSELDPLLVIAAVPRADIGHLQSSVTTHHSASHLVGTATDLPTWYADWNRNRRVSQSPSLEGSTLPWVLRVPLSSDALTRSSLGMSSAPRSRPATGRPRWTWLWSLPALALVLTATGLGVVVRDHRLRTEYCESNLSGANQDSRRVPTPDGKKKECVGVATGDVTFPVGQEVQELIREANDRITGSNYVTIVYAGPLSGSVRDGKQLVKGLEELRGAYLVQRANNEEQPVKLRILVANGGTDMNSQSVMADRIVDLARKDRTIVGVVGLGRDMTDSEPVQEKLRKAELPVVSGTNSGTYLLDLPNFFSLAATDQWQARQLGLLAEQLKAESGENRAVVLARDPGGSHDRYTEEQKKYGHEMLQNVGYRVKDLDDYELRNDRPVLDSQIDDICTGGNVPRVVFFAGRAEDVTTLMDGITSKPGCDRKQIAVLAGDDLSQAGFEQESSSVAANVTLYHFILTAPRRDGEGSLFLDRLRKISGSPALGLDRNTRETSKELTDGQTMLMHDATEVLYRAAQQDGEPRGRAEAWAGLLRTNVAGLATGRIDLRNSSDQSGKGLDAGTRDNYVISLMKVANPGSGNYVRTLLCSRRAGDGRPLTQQECDIDKGTHAPGS